MDLDAASDALLHGGGAAPAAAPCDGDRDARILAFRAKVREEGGERREGHDWGWIGGNEALTFLPHTLRRPPRPPPPPRPRARAAPRAAPTSRPLPSAPLRVLDAPDLVDDFYLNTLAWSSSGTVAVGLGRDVYLWSSTDSTVSLLPRGTTGGAAATLAEDEYISSVAWAGDGRHLAVGVAGGSAGAGGAVQLWDAGAGRQLRVLRGHAARVGALSWSGSSLASGGRDSVVLTHDVRARDHVTARLAGHAGEVCGLAWSACGALLASGGNDNTVRVWRPPALGAASTRAAHVFADHTAAVKAVAWNPLQPALLATGGGAADKRIAVYNTHTGARVASVDTGAQVCALAWAPSGRALYSSHGYSAMPGAPSNAVCAWNYPSLTKTAQLDGHTARVLHMALSPDGASVATAAADETLRFWRVAAEEEGGGASGAGLLGKKVGVGARRPGTMAAVTVR